MIETTCIRLHHTHLEQTCSRVHPTIYHLLRCVVFCFLSNLVPSSTVALPLLASRVLSEVARRQLFIVEGLSARHLVPYVNLFFLLIVKHEEKELKTWSRQKVNND